MNACTVKNCKTPAHARGLCAPHYRAARREGSDLPARAPRHVEKPRPSFEPNGHTRELLSRPDRPKFGRGDRVLVREEGLAPWYGAVVNVKPSGNRWWIDIDADAGLSWAVDSRIVERSKR